MVKHSLLVLWSLQLTSCDQEKSKDTPANSKERMRRNMDKIKKSHDRTRARIEEELRKNNEEQLKKLAETLRNKAAANRIPEKDPKAYNQIDESYDDGDY
jgi:hypothetical protein